MLIGREPGGGKSSAENLIVAHAHYRRMITTAWQLGSTTRPGPAAAPPAPTTAPLSAARTPTATPGEGL